MFYKISPLSYQESAALEERYKPVTGFSAYNVAPPNFREVDIVELSNSRFDLYMPTHVEYRQLLVDSNGKTFDYAMSVTLYHLPDKTGWAMYNDTRLSKVRFFLFGCSHEFTSPPEDVKKSFGQLYRCQSIVYCGKCGYTSLIDSSD